MASESANNVFKRLPYDQQLEALVMNTIKIVLYEGGGKNTGNWQDITDPTIRLQNLTAILENEKRPGISLFLEFAKGRAIAEKKAIDEKSREIYTLQPFLATVYALRCIYELQLEELEKIFVFDTEDKRKFELKQFGKKFSKFYGFNDYVNTLYNNILNLIFTHPIRPLSDRNRYLYSLYTEGIVKEPTYKEAIAAETRGLELLQQNARERKAIAARESAYRNLLEAEKLTGKWRGGRTHRKRTHRKRAYKRTHRKRKH